MTSKRWNLETHRDYKGSPEDIAGAAPSDDQVITAAELADLKEATDEYAGDIEVIKPKLEPDPPSMVFEAVSASKSTTSDGGDTPESFPSTMGF